LLEARRGEPTARELDRQEINWSQFVAVCPAGLSSYLTPWKPQLARRPLQDKSNSPVIDQELALSRFLR
jgi:hypothetical protein